MLSILIPSREGGAVHEFVEELERLLPVSEIIICNDREQKGKGWALREALRHAKGDQIAFIDGDGEIPARMMNRLLPFLEDFDVVVGSKRITHSPLRRRVMTRLTRIWFKFLFGVKVDTQTGIKLFRRSAFDYLDNYWNANGFIFDLEILELLQRKGFSLVEVPVEVEIRRQLAFTTIFRITGESIWLKFRLLFHVGK